MQRTALSFDGVRYRLGRTRGGDSCVRCHRGPFVKGSPTMVDPHTGAALCHGCVRDLVDPMELAWMTPSFTFAGKEAGMENVRDIWGRFPGEPEPEAETWSLDDLLTETKSMGVGQTLVVLHPDTGQEVEVSHYQDGMWVIQDYDGQVYIEATTALEGLAALYAGPVLATLASVKRAMTAIAKGQKPSLVDHLALGTHTALNLPGSVPDQSTVPETTNLPDPDLVPRTTKPGVRPSADPAPPDPSGEVEEEVQEDLPSTADVQAMRRRTSAANPHLSAAQVDELVHDALVLAWRD